MMDFLDPKKKRAHKIRLMIGYCLATIALMLASVILLFTALGYSISTKTGEVIQNGLVFVDAHPEQADIFINGQDKGKTDGRFVLEAGKYTLELQRDGYRPWKRDFILGGANIVRLVYPFLFPQNLESRDILSFSAEPDLVSESPDRKWVVMHSPDNIARFQVLDTSTDELEVVPVDIPAAILGNKTGTQRMEAIEWSTDNRHLLIKHSYAGGFDYFVLDREDSAASYNITQTFGKQYSTVTLRDKKFDLLYLHDAATGQLLAGNAKDKTTSLAASDVLAFWPYKNNVLLYATNKDAPTGKSLVKLKEGTVTYTVREIARGGKYLLNLAEFDGNTYLAAGSVADGKLYVFKNPFTTLKNATNNKPAPSILLKVDNAQYVSFSANARFIALQGGSMFAVYDFETKLHYKYDTKLPLQAAQQAKWMDGHRLTLISGNKLVVFDYDGLNTQTLVDAKTGYMPLFDRDYNQLFTVSPSLSDASKSALVRTDINLGEE